MLTNLFGRMFGRNLHKHDRLTVRDFYSQSGGTVRPCYLCGELCLKSEMRMTPVECYTSDLLCLQCADDME